jgi:hypothetical protein
VGYSSGWAGGSVCGGGVAEKAPAARVVARERQQQLFASRKKNVQICRNPSNWSVGILSEPRYTVAASLFSSYLIVNG